MWWVFDGGLIVWNGVVVVAGIPMILVRFVNGCTLLQVVVYMAEVSSEGRK